MVFWWLKTLTLKPQIFLKISESRLNLIIQRPKAINSSWSNDKKFERLLRTGTVFFMIFIPLLGIEDVFTSAVSVLCL